jgi:predicted acylesterase/phospholipase RssA
MHGQITVLVASLVVASSPTGADPQAQARPVASTVSLTVSGGVSLGAYEAGFLTYAIAEVQQEERSNLGLVTGASAGSMNALLAVLVACGGHGPTSNPAESLFWQSWVPVGFDQLSSETPTALGAFSRTWLHRQAARVEEAWNRGIDPSCDVVLGVSTTRMEARVLRAAGGRLSLPRMEEKFAIRIQGRGPGLPPRATNYVSPGGAVPTPLLVTDEGGEIAFQELRDLVFASMAFPVAFEPQPLRTCVAGETATPGMCLASEAETARYVDGGIFDNAPLRMAVSLARTGLRAAEEPGRLEWRPLPDAVGSTLPAHVAFVFVDPDATEYPSTPPHEVDADAPSLPRELRRISSTLIETARSKELAILLEEHPDVADRIVVPRRRFPAAGSPLFAFLGFFEEEFRVFDFNLGMYDAWRTLFAEVRDPGGTLLVEASRVQEPSGGGRGWERFACMRAVYEGAAEADVACRGDELADFRALLQVSLDQLYDACRAGDSERHAWTNPHCDLAAAGHAPPRVPGVSPERPAEWRRRPDEQELAYSMRLLGDYGFRFKDIGVPPGRGDLAVARIRRALGRAGHEFARAQPGPDRGVVTFAAKLAADSVAYSAPDRTLHLSMGPTESEIGYTRGFADSTWMPPGFRLTAALAFRGLEGALTSGDTAPFAALLVGGLELQPRRNVREQLRLGLRAGWMFSGDDESGAGTCDDGSESVSACTRPVVQAVVGYTLLERFRVQMVGEWFPGIGHKSNRWSLAPGIGLELSF